MFERLFSYPSVLRRHFEGPLAAERSNYLKKLAAQGMARSTILDQARYSLCIAKQLQRWPSDHCFNEDEVRALAAEWAAKRVAQGHALSHRWPEENFRSAAIAFLRSCCRLRSPPASEGGRYERELAEFIATQKERRWFSAASCRMGKINVTRFLDYLEQRDIRLADLVSSDIDAYFQHMSLRWSRNSLRISANILRSWFAHCEKRGWVRAGLANAVMLPRLYRHESLPLGPTWDEIGRMLTNTSGDDPASLRDHAVILLLSVYGLRSSEVRRLQFDDIDWYRNQIRIVRSKGGRKETLPLEPRTGNAIARYLRHSRPRIDSRVLFLTLRAPYRPLSTPGLYNLVRKHLSKVSSIQKGRGPHALRHSCARHLIETGCTFKEVGDHLGHRSPDSTRFYAKVDLISLRRVAFDDLGGLT